MRIVLGAAIIPVVLGVVLAGCAQKRTTSAARTASTTPAAPPNAGESDTPNASADPQEKVPRVREAGVYVDGIQVGVLRRQELPPTIRTITLDGRDGDSHFTTYLWAFTDYAKSVGIDPTKVKALHVHGGRRIAVVDSAELASLGDTLRFGFTMNERGKPKMVWPAKAKHPTVDMVSAVAFYVEKEPPTYDKLTGSLVMPDGTRVDENKMPYEPADANSGTRVYVDGSLVGAVKRKKLTNDLLVSKSDEASRFSLMGFAAKLGVETKQAKAVDLLAGDDVIAHMATPKDLDTAKHASFRVPQRNQGKIVVDLPEGAAKVSAVQIYVKTKPPVRAVTKLDDAPAAAPGSGPGMGEGPGDDDN